MSNEFLKVEQIHLGKNGREICKDCYLIRFSEILYVNWFESENGDNECAFFFKNPEQKPVVVKDVMSDDSWQGLIKILGAENE